MLLKRFAEIIGARAQFSEQPRIFNGNDRLFGEVRDEIGLLIAKKTHFPARERDRSNTHIILEHRHRKDGADARYFHRRHRQHVTAAISRTLAEVRHLYRLAALRGKSNGCVRARLDESSASPLLDEGFRPFTVQRGAAEPLTLAQPDDAVTGLT